jgi:putative thiamine transport system substrate-binding protein
MTRLGTPLSRGGLRLAACLAFTISAFWPVHEIQAQHAGETRPWSEIVETARGQTVHFNAWGGDDRINAYIDWVGERVARDHGITLEHVKLSDTADAVARVLAEKVAGRDTGGSVDLIWINGENFAAMKRQGLLHGPWVGSAPNFSLVDVANKPTTILDFQVPTDGLEAPWGMAHFVFMYDTALVAEPPRNPAAMLRWAEANPGRLSYPRPPDFIGTTFLKQLLVTLTEAGAGPQSPLGRPIDEADPQAITAPLWRYLDELHPHLWRSGRAFPENGPAQIRLLADREIAISMAFNPAEASSAIAAGLLPDTVRTFVFEGGMLANTHFVAVPYNAAGKEAAMVVANVLMSAEAQAQKQDPRIWGDFTVLDLAALTEPERARFRDLPLGIATLSPDALGPSAAEPHPSWSAWLEAEWERRYAAGR